MSKVWLVILVPLALEFVGVQAFAENPVPKSNIVFMIGEREYDTEQSLRQFFARDLASRGFEATFITAPDSGAAKHDFVGIREALASADLLFLSVRRRAPRKNNCKPFVSTWSLESQWWGSARPATLLIPKETHRQATRNG